MTISEITDINFKSKVLSSPKLIVVDFWAEWCGPCKIMAENLKQLHVLILDGNLNTKVDLFTLNVDQSPETASLYSIRSIPALLFFKKGELVQTEVGVKSDVTLLTMINNHLAI